MPIDPINLIVKGREWYLSWKKRKGAIYGASGVGKSTFIKATKFDGLFPDVKPNTRGISKPIKIKTEVYGEGKSNIRNRKFEICDTEGSLSRQDLLKADMWLREPEWVIIMVDHSHIVLPDGNENKENNILMVKIIVDAIVADEYYIPKRKFFRKYIKKEKKHWKPAAVAICLNKLDKMIELNIPVEKVWMPFKDDLSKLSNAGIHNMIWSTCAYNQKFIGSQIKEMMDWLFKKVEQSAPIKNEDDDNEGI